MKTICVVTGTRAEYGLLKWLMHDLNAAEDMKLQIVVTGMHLSPEFGLTYKEIEADGFQIDYKVEMLLSGDSAQAVTKSVGLATIGFADAFATLNPDVVIILGDRFEMLAAAQAAMLAQLPIAHIHGGEITTGALDDQIRHSITKMSNYHFVATEQYRQRVIQMGEMPHTVWNVGTLGMEAIKRTKLMTEDELRASLQFDWTEPLLLVTYHPETSGSISVEQSIDNLLQVLADKEELNVIFTKANADINGRIINAKIEEFVKEHSNRMKVFASLGQRRYFSLLPFVTAVVGNSSSGIIEVPYFRKNTVNIGDRQTGRLKAKTIIDCETDIVSIRQAVDRALTIQCGNIQLPYGQGETSQKIIHLLRTVKLGAKRFYDLVEGAEE